MLPLSAIYYISKIFYHFRLEAGLCLYGHDINEDTTPVEATLLWLVGKFCKQTYNFFDIYFINITKNNYNNKNPLYFLAKRRRAEANFPGAQVILSQIKEGPKKKRVGLTLGHGPPARENAAILTTVGELVGKVTSGGPSPSLGKPIAMGYVPTEMAQTGTNMLVEIRGKTYKAVITKMPFIKSNYYTGK